MGDGSAEWSVLGRLGVNMNPLMVTGGVGEQVDLGLVDEMPFAIAEVSSDQVVERFDAVHGGSHIQTVGEREPTDHRARIPVHVWAPSWATGG